MIKFAIAGFLLMGACSTNPSVNNEPIWHEKEPPDWNEPEVEAPPRESKPYTRRGGALARKADLKEREENCADISTGDVIYDNQEKLECLIKYVEQRR